MVSAAALARRNRKTLSYLRPPDAGPDLILQLFGAQPEELAEAAFTAQEAGFRDLDFNMGCPVPKVVKSGAGSALLLDVARAERCLRALRRATAGRLTVKLRSGWDAAHLNYLEMGALAADCGADGVTLHARTRAQGYSGQADWGHVADLARQLPIPVVGNGDVDSGQEAAQKLSATGCAGVMIGRAALARPWIFADAESCSRGGTPDPAPSPAAIGDDLLLHLEDLIRDKGERLATLEIRKFTAWATRSMPGAAPFRRSIQESATPGEFRQRIRGFFGTDLQA
jgi:nifR3 family TIM-barrel protein